MTEAVPHRLGLRTRLAIVVACAALPAVLFLAVWTEMQRRAAFAEARAWTERMAEVTAERHADFYHAVRATLEMLAISPAVRSGDVAGCSTLLRDTQRRRPWLAYAWVVDDAGTTVCATDATVAVPALDAATRAQMASSEFGMSDIVTHGSEPVLLAAMRVDGGTIISHMIVESRLDIRHLEGYATLPEGRDAGLVIAMDRNGRALSFTGHHDEHVGKQVSDHPVIQALLNTTDAVTGTVHDGIERILSSAVVPEWGATVVVGIGTETVLATTRRGLATGVAISLAILLAMSALGWISADRLIMRSVRVVRDAAVAMADGAMGRRAEVGGAPREIRELAQAFNHMTERLERLALHDQLTGLPNRRFLNGRLAEIERAGLPAGVMVLDTDRFKQINDRYGHAFGDEVLKELAARLVATVGDEAFCARVGGDEFVIVVTALEAAALPLKLAALGERIRAALEPPIEHDGEALAIAGSIGAAVRDASVANFIQLFHHADRALYAAKAAGRNRMVVFDGTQPDTAPEQDTFRSPRTASRTAAA
jgi:diguanylate cyclase (GGDEF)-like protein